MTVTQAAAGGLEQLGLASVTGTGGLAGLVLDEEAQRQPRVVAQAAVLHSMGVRVRSRTLFYEEWLGKLPITELEQASLMFDIGEVHRAGYSRAKRILDVPLAVAGGLVLVVLTPMEIGRASCRERVCQYV